ncbi:MAG: aldehyde ferredoxin oxidoreductase family protein, partial [Deltaproteobacteria bacterium]|nr:aldehyde ferredoxin oxidoreductase family protein [Deltaproteobacteria bacterium]
MAYKNCILEIDLTNKRITKHETDQGILREFIGGSGLASRLFLELGNADAEPFSENNNIYIMTGPLTGTKFPGTGRFTAAAKSPLTGVWGESNCGGNFGPELKFAGFDGIIIKGISPSPVYILIEDENVQIHEASEIWGLDTFQVSDFFKAGAHGNKKFKVLSIGPAGENLVRYAGIMNDKSDALGRCGLGAVMGSKKLKAIVVRGTGKAWKPHQDGEYDQFIKSVLNKIKESPFAKTMHNLGTSAGLVVGRKTGDIPTKNWSLGESNDFARPLLPYTMKERYFVRHRACFACPVGCKKEVKVDKGAYKTEENPAPEYESFCSLGTMLLIKDMEAIIKIHNICNRYGLDVISCGSTISFAFECFERGLITKGDTGGLDLKWGDADVVIKLLEKIAYRNGLGDLLAEGSRIAAKRIGKNASDYTVEVKGLELPMHDPRAFHGIGLAYATSVRGACHLQHLVHFVETNFTSHSELDLLTDYERLTSEGKAEMTVICEDFGMVVNAAPICQFVFGALSADDVVYMLKKTTGFDYDLDEVKRSGEILWYLKRLLNNIMGLRASDDQLPKKVMV